MTGIDYDTYIKYYVLAIHTLILLRIFAGFLSAYACMYASKEMSYHDPDKRSLVRLEKTLEGLAIFHLIIAILSVFVLLMDDYNTPDYIHAIQTLTWTIGIVLSSYSTIRLSLFLVGVTNGVHVLPDAPAEVS